MLSLAVPLQHLSFPDDFQRLIGAKTHRLAKFLWFGLQGDTRKQYASAVRSYTGFMQIEHPREKPWPVQEQLLCEFAAWRLEGSPGNRKLVGTSVEQYISGIRSYHVDRGWDTSAFSSETHRRIIKGAHNIFGYEKRVRYPITRDILEKDYSLPSRYTTRCEPPGVLPACIRGLSAARRSNVQSCRRVKQNTIPPDQSYPFLHPVLSKLRPLNAAPETQQDRRRS
ncbi:hypothetical protein B0A52_08069 [Exophiala mesophila]|uniref:Uncharacterized protein n=1 Tax=Exophiala mesophila TaxID=212818 RepID=A0A438MZZ1_EXOME|nr:hypothetical protein B0A52_08069 [Exophiala mesophila]